LIPIHSNPQRVLRRWVVAAAFAAAVIFIGALLQEEVSTNTMPGYNGNSLSGGSGTDSLGSDSGNDQLGGPSSSGNNVRIRRRPPTGIEAKQR
jgi:hypothetical protein